MKKIDYLNLMITYHHLINDKQAVEHFRRKLYDAVGVIKIKNK